jgi:hypothetical protein
MKNGRRGNPSRIDQTMYVMVTLQSLNLSPMMPQIVACEGAAARHCRPQHLLSGKAA